MYFHFPLKRVQEWEITLLLERLFWTSKYNFDIAMVRNINIYNIASLRSILVENLKKH